MSTNYKGITGSPLFADSINIIGTGGYGFMNILSQNTAPIAGIGEVSVFNNAGKLSWVDDSATVASMNIDNLTADREYELPNISGELLTNNSTSVVSNKTILSADGNIVDSTSLLGTTITGSFNNGNTLQYNSAGPNWEPLSLTANLPLVYSSGTFSINVGATTNTVAAGDDPRLSAAQTVIVKKSNPGNGEYTSIGSAIASITDAAINKRYVVFIYPGTYLEAPIIGKEYVSVLGSGSNNTIIRAINNATTQFEAASNSTISDLGFSGLYGGVTDKAIGVDGCVNFGVRNVAIRDYHTLIYISAATAMTSAIISEIVCLGAFNYGIHMDGRSITGINPCSATITNILIGGDGWSGAMRIEGPYVSVTTLNTQIVGYGSGVGFSFDDGSAVNISNLQVSNCSSGIFGAPVGTAPSIRSAAITLLNNTTDLAIYHPGTTGVFSGVADKNKVHIDNSANISLFFTDPVVSGSVISGDLFLARYNIDNSVEIGDMITYSSPTGEFTSGGVVIVDSGLDVEVSEGSGYVLSGSYPNGTLKKVSWGDSIVTLPASSTTYIYVDENGLNTALSLPNNDFTFPLARIRTGATDIEFIDKQIANLHTWYKHLMDRERAVVGALYSSGSLVTSNLSRELAITAGRYYFLNNEFLPAGQTSPASWFAYYHSGGNFTRIGQTVVSNTQYDDGNDLAAIPPGKYIKHTLYTVNEGVNEQYFLVYGQYIFDTLLEAISGSRPIAPNYFEQGVIPIADIIVQEGMPEIQEIIDIRPRLGGGAAQTSTVVTNHGDLSGLGADDHPQYLLVNGAREMTGNLDIGGGAIVNASSINGVVIENHGGRHLPNGADPLDTAAPLAALSSITTNNTGTANSFSRSDHSHQINIAGFDLNNLSGILDVPHGGTGVASLTSGRFVVGNGVAAVSTTKVVPAGDVVGTTDTQTLTGKTIIGGIGGNDIAANEIRNVNVSAAAPAANQVLIASNGTNASWGNITNSNISGAIDVPHGGTGVASLTSGRFVVGNGVAAVSTTKVVPAGDVVGTTDTQTLTGKTLSSTVNSIDATAIRTQNISAAVPGNGQLLGYNSLAGQWGPVTINLGALAEQRWIFRDEKPPGTQGGTALSGGWRLRNINTQTGSADSSVSLAGGDQIKISKGMYYFRVSATAFRVGYHRCRIWDVNNSIALAYGTQHYTATNVTSISEIMEYVEIPSTTLIEFQHSCTITRTSTGWGLAMGIGGVNEIYLTVTIEKLN
jgi:hypothetical protein